MVKGKKVLLEYSNCIKAHIDIIGEAFEVHNSVALEFFLEEEFIEFWWYYLMFESPHVTIVCRMFTFQWWILIVKYGSTVVR